MQLHIFFWYGSPIKLEVSSIKDAYINSLH